MGVKEATPAEKGRVRKLLKQAIGRAKCELVDFRFVGDDLVVEVMGPDKKTFTGREYNYLRLTDDALLLRFYRFALHYGQKTPYRPSQKTLPSLMD